MGEWDILELEPTEDVAAIKKAYFKKCMECQPDADPAGLELLTNAYNQVLRQVTAGADIGGEYQLADTFTLDQMLQWECETTTGDTDTTSRVWQFMDRVKEIYKNTALRHNENEWRLLLASDMLCSDLVKEQVSDQLLHFLTARSLPQHIWKRLDECFFWTGAKDELYRKFPAYMVSFILGEIEGSNWFETRLGKCWSGLYIMLAGLFVFCLTAGFNKTSLGLLVAGTVCSILLALLGIYIFYGQAVSISNYDKVIVVKTLAGKRAYRFDEIKGFGVSESAIAIMRILFIIPVVRQKAQTIVVYLYDQKGAVKPPVELKYNESLIRILARHFPYLGEV